MKITKEELKQIIKEELSASIEEGASMKVPVEQYEDFKKRLEKFYTHYEKFSESMKYQLQSRRYANALKVESCHSEEETARLKDEAKVIRGEFAKFNRQLHALDRHLADLLQQYNFKTEYWATQAMKARQDLALEEKK